MVASFAQAFVKIAKDKIKETTDLKETLNPNEKWENIKLTIANVASDKVSYENDDEH